MIYRAVLLWGIVLSFSCQKKKAESSIKSQETDTLSTEKDSKPVVPEEYFTDSLTIGRKGKNKVELSKYRTTDSVYVVIKLYSQKETSWLLKNKFTLLKDGVLSIDPIVSDFNNDGYNDVTYQSAIAGRGANEIRTLFIYDKKKDQLIHIKNSDSYANLQYNKKLKCVDAFNVYGGSTSYFLNIVGDSLKPFASVELYEGLTIREYDKYGNETVIHSDTSVKKSYGRYKSYQPLIEYDEY